MSWTKSKQLQCNKNYYAEMRHRAVQKLGGKCVRCGFADERALQIDHVNCDGWLVRVHESRHRMLKRVLAGNHEDLQLLCANCNVIKAKELDEYTKNMTVSGPTRFGIKRLQLSLLDLAKDKEFTNQTLRQTEESKANLLQKA